MKEKVNRITHNFFPTIIIRNQLTLTKTCKLLKLAIVHKNAMIQGLLDPKMDWNQDQEISRNFASGLADFLENDVTWLEAIMKQIPPLPKCKHPKELRDKCDGKYYCMGCNEDLTSDCMT